MKETKIRKIKELHMDTYMNEPYTLLSRVIDENVSHYFKDNRVILRDKDDAVLANIPLDEVKECCVKKFASSHYQILFNLRDVQYKVLAVM